ncbi:MAG TPA: isoprenylcysteine carboxylmethyltransferase family protein [Longimicrobiales bacterium]|nr:isoprenylcysteine carboxylmethyltransferase family protein [Longimicrobiales bacterium]
MFPLLRALIYGSLFVALLLVLLPARVLEWSGVSRPEPWGAAQAAGAAITVLGAAVAVWCVLAFALVGRGTPAPFDPPRRLVVSGPYRFVRNPMYIGAGLALAGASLFYGSAALLGYTALLGLVTHLFVTRYEEPTLSRTFGAEYTAYRSRVRRWRPGRGTGSRFGTESHRPLRDTDQMDPLKRPGA